MSVIPKNKKRILRGIGFDTTMDTRENFHPFIVYDGILTEKGNLQVENIQGFWKDGSEILFSNTEWPEVDKLALDHWLTNSKDIMDSLTDY
jgi:hypothetical protein